MCFLLVLILLANISVVLAPKNNRTSVAVLCKYKNSFEGFGF